MQPAGLKMSSRGFGVGPPLTTRYHILKLMALAVVDRFAAYMSQQSTCGTFDRTHNHVHVESGRTCRQSETW